MALSATIILPGGVQATYHKITTLFVKPLENVTTIEVARYASQAVRQADVTNFVFPVVSFDLTGLPPEEPSTPTGTRTWAYTQMKAQLADYSGATDV